MGVAGSLTYKTELDTKEFSEGLSKIGNITKSTFKGLGVAIGAVATAIGGLTVAATNAYSEFEQLAGGAKKIFDEVDYSQISKDAQEAYKTMGMSANDYLRVINDVGANFASTMGDQKGYDTAKRGLQAISDYASGTGKNVDELSQKFTLISRSTSSYQSIADQFSGILPATSKEFLKQAQEVGYLSKEYDKLTDVPIDKYQEALSKMLAKGTKDIGLMGNTFAESETTITGSLAAMKGAWDNMLVSFASGEGVEVAIQNLFASISAFATQLMPVVMTVLEQVPVFITELLTRVVEQIPLIIETLVPTILQSAVTILNTLIQGIQDNLGTIVTAAMNIITTLINGLVDMLPNILKTGIDILLELVKGLKDTIPELIPVIIDVILQIVDTLIENLDLIIMAAVDIILALAFGLIDALPKLIEKIPQIITKLVTELTKPAMLGKLITGAIQLIVALATGLIKAIPQLVKEIPKIISAIVTALTTLIKETDWLQLGKDILNGILNGLINFGTVVKDAVKKVGKKITNEIKSFFGIKSPSRLMRDEVGKYIPQGIAVGIDADTDSALNSIDKMNDEIMDRMNQAVNTEMAKASFSGTSGSVSQILSANSVIQVQNYNTLELDGETVYANQQQVQQRKNLQYGFGGGSSK